MMHLTDHTMFTVQKDPLTGSVPFRGTGKCIYKRGSLDIKEVQGKTTNFKSDT